MNPVPFPEQTTVWAENQPPFLPLPAYSDREQTISCWSLSWGERLRLLWSGRLWLRQMNYEQPLQAQAPSVTSPFIPQPGGPHEN